MAGLLVMVGPLSYPSGRVAGDGGTVELPEWQGSEFALCVGVW